MCVIKVNNSNKDHRFHRTWISHIAFKTGQYEACFANRRHRVPALSLLTTEPTLKYIKLVRDGYTGWFRRKILCFRKRKCCYYWETKFIL